MILQLNIDYSSLSASLLDLRYFSRLTYIIFSLSFCFSTAELLFNIFDNIKQYLCSSYSNATKYAIVFCSILFVCSNSNLCYIQCRAAHPCPCGTYMMFGMVISLRFILVITYWWLMIFGTVRFTLSYSSCAKVISIQRCAI